MVWRFDYLLVLLLDYLLLVLNIYINLYLFRFWFVYIMYDDVCVMIKGVKDGILVFVYSICLIKIFRIKKI